LQPLFYTYQHLDLIFYGSLGVAVIGHIWWSLCKQGIIFKVQINTLEQMLQVEKNFWF